MFALQWPHVFFKEDGTGLIQIVEGKSRAAKRVLPMTPRAYINCCASVTNHVIAQACDRSGEGWIFPSASKHGHFNGDAAKEPHKKALADSGVKAFVPYTLRHTALTRLGDAAGDDVFVLSRIARHSSIIVTQRYVHPQAEAIHRVFAASQLPIGTKVGTAKKLPEPRPTQETRVNC